jgi:hypothetical protein
LQALWFVADRDAQFTPNADLARDLVAAAE